MQITIGELEKIIGSERLAKKMIKGPRRRKKSSIEKALEKRIKPMRIKNPSTGRQVSLWSFRVMKPKRTLRQMPKARRKAFLKLHKLYKREEAKALKVLRKQHGVNKKHQRLMGKLPDNLVGRHDYLVKEFADHKFDIGNGPQPLKKIIRQLKRKSNDPNAAQQYAKLMIDVDKANKKERANIVKKVGDHEMTNPVTGEKQTLQDILKEATKKKDAKMYQAAMKQARTIHKVKGVLQSKVMDDVLKALPDKHKDKFADLLKQARETKSTEEMTVLVQKMVARIRKAKAEKAAKEKAKAEEGKTTK